MEHADHVALLRGGFPTPGGVWADLGAGTGAFTLALAELLGPGGEIHAIDRDSRALRENERAMTTHYPGVRIDHLEGDFVAPLNLPLLDGMVLANSLHYQDRPAGVLSRLREHLRPGGRVIVVEYNIEHGNRAVPHPVPFHRWERLAHEAGLEGTEMLARRPSRTFGEIYSAMSRRPDAPN